MTVSLAELDAHEQPSDEMRAEWKHFYRLDPSVVVQDPRIDDPRLPLSENGFQASGKIDKTQVTDAFAALGDHLRSFAQEDIPVISHSLLPGKIKNDPQPGVPPPSSATSHASLTSPSSSRCKDEKLTN